jgi:hypothetical protein
MHKLSCAFKAAKIVVYNDDVCNTLSAPVALPSPAK